jgi:heme-degrading monooxygenase HmoA
MEIVLVDTFIVPEAAKQEFKEAALKARSFIETLPGYVEGSFYEQAGGESQYNFFTTAVWQDEAAFETAKQAVLTEYQRRNYDPAETRKRLGIQQARSTYNRV